MRIRLIPGLGAAVAVIAALGALAGCAADDTATATTTAALEQSTLVVDSVPAAEEAGLYVAQAQGLFAKQGLTVKIKSVTGGETAIPDLQSGKAQVVEGNYVSFILAQMNHQANLRIIAAGSEIEPGTEALYVMPNSKYRSVADLAKAHAKVGLNTRNNIGDVLMGALLEQYGYQLDAIKRVYPATGFAGVMTDLKKGVIDAAWLPQPLADEAEQDFGAVPLADFDTGSLQDFPFTGFIGTTPWIESHPHTVAAFLRAIEQGQELADTSRPDVEAAMREFGVAPGALVSDTMSIDSYPLEMDAIELQRVADSMFEFKVSPTDYNIKNMLQPEPGLIGG